MLHVFRELGTVLAVGQRIKISAALNQKDVLGAQFLAIETNKLPGPTVAFLGVVLNYLGIRLLDLFIDHKQDDSAGYGLRPYSY